MKFSVFILYMVLFSAALFAQAPDTLWTKTFGGIENDRGNSVQQTTDGGYIITGYTKGAGEGDVWLIKTDINGDTLWTKTFGDSGYGGGNSVQQTSDGGYIITGYTGSLYTGSDVWLIKTDTNGDTLWTKTFGGIENDGGNSVQQTTDGGYIIAGTTNSFGAGNSDVWLIKTDANGDTLWTKTFGDSISIEGISVQQTNDAGYIIAGTNRALVGSSISIMAKDWEGGVLLIKTDSNGDMLWTNTITGRNYLYYGNSVQQTSDGGYIITGADPWYPIHFGTYSYVWLVRTYANGDTIWTKSFGDSLSFDEGYSVQQTNDGGYIITGFGRMNGRRCWLIKTDANGDTLWTKTSGASNPIGGYSVQQTFDGGYIIAGATGGDVWLAKIAPDVTAIDENPQTIITGSQLQQNYPNPFNPTTTIKYQLAVGGKVELTIYNLVGQQILALVNVHQPAGVHQEAWDGRDLSGKPVTSGIYFYQLKAGDDFAETKKMVLMR